MTELIAQGARAQDRWRKKLPLGTWVTLGRVSDPWSAAWDERISRQHVKLCFQQGVLKLETLPDARNPVFYRGRKVQHTQLAPGEHFVIGGTSFFFVDEAPLCASEAPSPAIEKTFSHQELQGSQYRQVTHKLEALTRLPELVASSPSIRELQSRLVSLLLASIPGCQAAAIISVTPVLIPEGSAPKIAVLQFDQVHSITATAPFQPSSRLIEDAFKKQQTVMHWWEGTMAAAQQQFTMSAGTTWAFCIPIATGTSEGLLLYAAGNVSHPGAALDAEVLHDEIKFAELAAMTLGHAQETRRLAEQQASLAPFFAPVVLSALEGHDPEHVLAPREADVTVLFCDLRGFSRESEKLSSQLLVLLARVSTALGVMTKHILAEGGVVGDFHGDSAMGFWGWPLASEDSVAKACRAALAIRREFALAEGGEGPLAKFRVGIGLATGRAVAGKIGTRDQVKVTVFGPVVNLAARLEGMTKQIRVPILLDEATAAIARKQVPVEVGRVRKLAKVRPEGMASVVTISELLLPESEVPLLTDSHLATFEEAITAIEQKDWERALRLLHAVPPEDLAKDFLTVFLARHNRLPPEHWDGVIPLP